MAPLYGGLLIAILAIVAVALSKNDKQAREDHEDKVAKKGPDEPKSNPFEGLVDEYGATPKSKAEVPEGEQLPPSPRDLLSNEIWETAEENGEQGKAMLKSAYGAEDAGNHALYKERALKARDLFDLALDSTVEWEIEIVEAHGESDRRVGQVLADRNTWFTLRKKLRKVEIKD